MDNLGDCCPQRDLTTNGVDININTCRTMYLLRTEVIRKLKTKHEPGFINR